MLNVEQMIQQQLPQVDQQSWLYRPVKSLLSYLLHEQDFQRFAERYPHLQGLEFVEQVLDYFNFSYAVRDIELERIPSSGRVVIIANRRACGPVFSWASCKRLPARAPRAICLRPGWPTDPVVRPAISRRPGGQTVRCKATSAESR